MSETSNIRNTAAPRRVKVIGIGRAGVRAGAVFFRNSGDGAEVFVCDTDAAELERSGLPAERRVLLDSEWRAGAGTGGNFTNAQRSMARERPKLEALVRDCDCLMVLAGLGGGTGTAGAVAMAGIARRFQLPAVFAVTLPFSMEGRAKQKIAESNWRDLVEISEITMALPNDLLFSAISADTPMAEAFSRADGELAMVCAGVAELLKGGTLLSADFATLGEIFHSRKSYCGIGVGRVELSESLNPGHLALERMLDSPFLGGIGKLKEADGVMFSVIGNEKLSIGEVNSIFEAAGKFVGPETSLVISAGAEPGFGERIQVMALTVKFLTSAPSPAAQDAFDPAGEGGLFAVSGGAARQRTGRKSKTGGAIQPPLPLEPVSRGIFIKTAQSVYNGADLDIPTWQRREIHIDKGE